ncbi:hypothetical protein [Desulfobacula sp.]|jgi:hypothetical protein|uniref:hypothetical protein n=1 Tax=Desulfobacula sp. TaxID=2593537 RepID=UPI0039B9B220|nr:hypothetical protein [Desulfobacula sp.]MBT7793427.1 hypothetical protein [Desulfobacula sp.]
MNEQVLQKLEKILSEKFPFGIPRKEIGKATGGILHPRTEANNDCSGEDNIQGGFKIGRQKIYPVKSVIGKLKSKMTSVA